MPIFGALGLGVTIIVLKVLTPEIFSALENVVLTFLHGAQVALDAASQLAAVAGQLSAH